MKSKLLIGAAIVSCMAWLGLTGCRQREQAVAPTSNGNFSVELLFEHEGVRVYRFYDGRWIYYTDARGKTSWDVTHTTGESTYVEHFDVPTAK